MDKILGIIGLAKRARAIYTGSAICEDAVKSGKSKLIIIANDASDTTKKSIKNSCIYYKVPFVEFSDMDSLGRITGGSDIAVVSVNDNNFAKGISDKLKLI